MYIRAAGGWRWERMVIASDKHAERFVYYVARNQLNYGTQRAGRAADADDNDGDNDNENDDDGDGCQDN